MNQIYISIGSNIDPDNNIKQALQTLRCKFGKLTLSTIYQNPAVGFEGDDFLNLVVHVTSALDVGAIASTLRNIEQAQGRDRQQAKFSSRTIDLDLLLFNNAVTQHHDITLPRDEIVKYAFVLCPLAELAGELIHPVTGKRYKDLWIEFDHSEQPMQAIDAARSHKITQ